MKELILLATLLSATAFGASIEFRQDGWSTSGPLVVSFTGIDTDLDGSLRLNELSEFQAIWQTPGGISSDWGLSHIEPGGFIFTNAGNFLMFVSNAEYSLVDTAFEGEFLATVFDANLFPVDSTTGAAQVVPEPAMFGLMGASLILLTATRLRRAQQGSSQQH